ncbi:disulfide bond formation protein DsbD [Rhodospirillales bacterium TMPK1]|uniref:Disulfide bond formation protein DsbD n=2 Tax=Roseiterribacter gracilis TaxID=2812848 RepID=A0A8S8XDX1_9PROT|nr:disulfide bond formation protein DsbD [Rhodospirillales bacterium TMPK1]
MVFTRYILLAALSLGLSAAAVAATPEQLAERSLGDAKAPVTVIEYASLTCSHCATFEREGLPQLKADYIDKGKVRLIFRDYPLDQYAVKASVALRCVAPAQFWALKEHLFRTQEVWAFSKDPLAAMKQQVKLAGLSDAALDACLADQQLGDSILNSRLQGEQKFKIESTPTFIINDGAGRHDGAEWDKVKAAIDKALGSAAKK